MSNSDGQGRDLTTGQTPEESAVLLADLPAAMRALAASNESIAAAFKRRANRVFVTAIIAALAAIASSITAGVVLSNQGNNANILRDVEEATNPNSPFSQAADIKFTEAFDLATQCIEINSNRNYERSHKLTLTPFPTNCPVVPGVTP